MDFRSSAPSLGPKRTFTFAKLAILRWLNWFCSFGSESPTHASGISIANSKASHWVGAVGHMIASCLFSHLLPPLFQFPNNDSAKTTVFPSLPSPQTRERGEMRSMSASVTRIDARRRRLQCPLLRPSVRPSGAEGRDGRKGAACFGN